MKKLTGFILLLSLQLHAQRLPDLKISSNHRFLVTGKKSPFFWLGDTGWLLFMKCTREDAIAYLNDRAAKGFNVIQVMLIHDLDKAVNVYGDSAIRSKNIASPVTTPGADFADPTAYDFWDHVDYIVDEAAKRNIYMAMVPVWGGNIKRVSVDEVKAYATFLARRFRNKSNIIWLNGGDIRGGDALDKWNAMGATIKSIDKKHLMTFHPRGRNSSSAWFHDEKWLDFNMFQSGHKSYAQDTSSQETLHYGEDNWKYAEADYSLKPVKPVIDGEPSYEGIPYGLHDGREPYWQDYEIRRYAYWSVFSGCFGFTYGHNAVMQFYNTGDKDASFFPKTNWKEALQAPGAGQMHHLKGLMLSKPFLTAVPDQSLVNENGERYDRILALQGKKFAMFYVYNGRSFAVDLSKLGFVMTSWSWFNPRTGERTAIDKYNSQTPVFDPPGEKKEGNDWVLILE